MYSIRFLLIVTAAAAIAVVIGMELSRPLRIALAMTSVVESFEVGSTRAEIQDAIARLFAEEQLRFQLQISDTTPQVISDTVKLPGGYATIFFYENTGTFPDGLGLLTAIVVDSKGQPLRLSASK